MVRLTALHAHWAKHPPIQWLAAAYLKYEPPKVRKDDEPDENLLKLFQQFGLDPSKPGQKVVG